MLCFCSLGGGGKMLCLKTCSLFPYCVLLDSDRLLTLIDTLLCL